MPAPSSVHGSLLAQGQEPIETHFGTFALHRFLHLEGGFPVFALVRGALEDPSPLLTRVHSSCVTSEILGACDCDCADQQRAALAAIAAEGRGALFYLCQEGRGAGFVAKARDRMLVQASRERMTTFEAYEHLGLPHDGRDYRDVASLRALLGTTAPLRLLTNNPNKVSGLERAEVPIDSMVPLDTGVSRFNGHYLASKRRNGHALGLETGAPRSAGFPRPVERREPQPHPDLPDWLHVANYWLPVAASLGAGPASQEPIWLELHTWVDRVRGGERVLLVGPDGPGEAGGWLAQDWTDRFPLREERPARRAYRGWLQEIAVTGRGSIALLRPGEPAPDPFSELLRARPLPAP